MANCISQRRRSEPSSQKAIRFLRSCLSARPKRDLSRKSAEKLKTRYQHKRADERKKEYLDLLEKRYEAIQEERDSWMRKCEELQMQNKELQKQMVDLKSQIIDFDDVDVSDANFGSRAIETMENEIPNPFDIDVD